MPCNHLFALSFLVVSLRLLLAHLSLSLSLSLDFLVTTFLLFNIFLVSPRHQCTATTCSPPYYY